jgi:hypothetical protein
MEYFNCSICRQPYDENSRKAFMLECGHSHILNALNSLKDMEKNFSAGNAVI